ncbi:hypothetical protein OLZ71_003316 [Vibrio parahaemolyticus]|nr:hypothetical protein [Vibrio parahaemolyticus]HAS7012696.1 hypothetical protein [Vibrio parahaemolyticus]
MSIKQQIDDAIFLAENQRYLGALTNLLLAVAASSRKVFPWKEAKSIKKPKEDMRDNEAFKLFLGGRLRKLVSGDFGGPDIGTSGINVNFNGKLIDLETILYEYYRCGLVHNGELPDDIEFNPPSQNKSVVFSEFGASVSVTKTNKIVLEHEWIDLLVKVVTGARCNGELFGVEHFDLELKDGFEKDAHEEEINQKHDLEHGVYFLMKDAIRHITPEKINTSDDSLIKSYFSELVEQNVINGGAVYGFFTMEITDRDGNLQQKGIDIIKDISSAYQLVQV